MIVMSKKKCISCHKPGKFYTRNRGFSDNDISSRCVKCTIRDRDIYRKLHPYKCRKQNRIRTRLYIWKKLYGLSEKEWNDLFIKQGKKCAICGCTKNTSKKFWATDHDHKTKKIRGILCHGCNSSLGGFQDSIRILTSAIKYLKRNK